MIISTGICEAFVVSIFDHVMLTDVQMSSNLRSYVFVDLPSLKCKWSSLSAIINFVTYELKLRTAAGIKSYPYTIEKGQMCGNTEVQPDVTYPDICNYLFYPTCRL